MGYRSILSDGKGNILEEKILYTLERYKEILLSELKANHKERFPSEFKQINAALGLLDSDEEMFIKKQMTDLLSEYEAKKALIIEAKSLEEAHNVLHGL